MRCMSRPPDSTPPKSEDKPLKPSTDAQKRRPQMTRKAFGELLKKAFTKPDPKSTLCSSVEPWLRMQKTMLPSAVKLGAPPG